MLTNAFINKRQKPTESELSAALGPAKALWDRLLSEVSDECEIDKQEWNSYSPKAGWSLRLKRKKRNILYLAPSLGCFTTALILGDRAVRAARKSGLPKRVSKMIAEAKRYPEGTAIRIEVKGPRDIEVVKRLAVIKMEN
jgi:hypothetical protein